MWSRETGREKVQLMIKYRKLLYCDFLRVKNWATMILERLRGYENKH